MAAPVTTLYIIPYHRISSMTLTASPNGTGAMEAYLTTNQNKTALGTVLKVVEVTAIDVGHASYIQDLFIHSTL